MPRLTTAHNFPDGLPLYRFLGDLQYQSHLLGLKWSWGSLATLRHLPRVQYRQLILQEASWRLDLEDYSGTLTSSENITGWQKRWNWPRYMAIVQADQELFLDLNSLTCQDLLINTLKRLTRLQLIEWLRVPQSCCVGSPKGRLTHEVIIPFIQPSSVAVPPTLPTAHEGAHQLYVPGSEWLYLKIYSNGQIADWLLTRIGKLAYQINRQGLISHWFFIRYQDPEPHIRLRFHLTQIDFLTKILRACHDFFQPLVENGLIGSVKVDTYQREVERYSVQLIGLMEQLFWVDSKAVVRLLSKPLTEHQRLMAAMMGVDKLMDSFGTALHEKASLYYKLQEALFAQQENPLAIRKQLARQYRLNQYWLIDLFSERWQSGIEFNRIFKQRDRDMNQFLRGIQWQNESQKNVCLASMIHLFINRSFNTHQATYELLIYHHLYRLFEKEAQLTKNEQNLTRNLR